MNWKVVSKLCTGSLHSHNLHSHREMYKKPTVDQLCFGLASHQDTKTAIRVSYGANGSKRDIHGSAARLRMMSL